MTACACRAAHLAAVNALTEHNHLSCRAFRNWKIVGGRTSVWMRACWALRGEINRIAGWSCCARTRRDLRGTAFGAATIDDAVNPPAYIVGNIERAIRPHRQARGPMFSFGGRLHRSRETIRKYFALAGCMVPVERLKNDVVPALWVRGPIP